MAVEPSELSSRHQTHREPNRSQSGSGRIGSILAAAALAAGLAVMEGAVTETGGGSNRNVENNLFTAWEKGDIRCTAANTRFIFYPGTKFRTSPESSADEEGATQGNVAFKLQPGQRLTATNPVEYEQPGNHNYWLGVIVKGSSQSSSATLEKRLLWVNKSGLEGQVDDNSQPFFAELKNPNSAVTPWFDCRVENNTLVAVNPAQTGGNQIAYAEITRTSK
jgi:hypothetical protein